MRLFRFDNLLPQPSPNRSARRPAFCLQWRGTRTCGYRSRRSISGNRPFWPFLGTLVRRLGTKCEPISRFAPRPPAGSILGKYRLENGAGFCSPGPALGTSVQVYRRTDSLGAAASCSSRRMDVDRMVMSLSYSAEMCNASTTIRRSRVILPSICTACSRSWVL